MPATGHYFLNEGEDADQNALYEKYRLTSQHGPLLLMLLLLVATACIALVAIIFSEQVSGQPPMHLASLSSPVRWVASSPCPGC